MVHTTYSGVFPYTYPLPRTIIMWKTARNLIVVNGIVCISIFRLTGLTVKQHGQNWYMPETLSEVLAILESLPEGCKYRLVAGNTGTGLYILKKNNKSEIWKLKMDFNTGGTWRRVGQWTLMMKIYDFFLFC